MTTATTNPADPTVSVMLCDAHELVSTATRMLAAYDTAAFSLAGFAIPGRLQVAAIIGDGATYQAARRGVQIVSNDVAMRWGGWAFELQSSDPAKAAALRALAGEIADGPDNIRASDAIDAFEQAIAILERD
jgi:hypothetical protein